MKQLLTRCIVLLVAVGVAGGLAAQPPGSAGDPGLVAMKAIGWLAGTWRGEGWMRRGPGEPQPFRSSETVVSRLDGRVLIVEGLHHDNVSGDVVHHALATISYDPSSGKYRFSSHLASGQSGEYEADLVDGKFVWGMEIPNHGRMRYAIHIDGDRWHEIGEFSADGQEWHQSFQMDLVRVGDE